jgi:hypothetical protein
MRADQHQFFTLSALDLTILCRELNVSVILQIDLRKIDTQKVQAVAEYN